jgi:hypothetical protein
MKSYDGKEFVVEDNDTRIQLAADLAKLAKYKAGEVIPAGKNIGDDKIIPSRTRPVCSGQREEIESSL